VTSETGAAATERRIPEGTGRVPASLRLREALLRVMAFYWDAPVQFARLLQRVGMKRTAKRVLSVAFDVNPWDTALGEILCDAAFDLEEAKYAPGTMARAAFIMTVLLRSSPSERITEAYFDNLEAMLRARERRSEPGTLVLGMGPGRVGSTTLAAIIRSNEAAIATHENPPFLWWDPHFRQVDFHKRRFRLLLHHAPVVFDGAPWWLNAWEIFLAEFPSLKAIGLYRDSEAIVRSLARFPAPYQCGHAAAHNGLWDPTRWSATNPAYEVPEDAAKAPAEAKIAIIRRYVIEYHQRMTALAEAHPGRILLLQTEELDEPEARAKIESFIGLPVTRAAIRLNVGNADDSVYRAERF